MYFSKRKLVLVVQTLYLLRNTVIARFRPHNGCRYFICVISSGARGRRGHEPPARGRHGAVARAGPGHADGAQLSSTRTLFSAHRSKSHT